MQTELRWRTIAEAKDDPTLWRKDNGVYKTSITVLIRREDVVKTQSLMWVYNPSDRSGERIGLFADAFGPTHFAVVDGLTG